MTDKNGAPLAVGDIVTVRCRITRIWDREDWGNVALETVEPCYPGKDVSGIPGAINAKQLEREKGRPQ